MKTARERISEIVIDKANVNHIATSGVINGSLLHDLERVIKEYALDACREQREICAKSFEVPDEPDANTMINEPAPELK